MSLTYDDPTKRGKSEAAHRHLRGSLRRARPDERVVEDDPSSSSADPALRGRDDDDHRRSATSTAAPRSRSATTASRDAVPPDENRDRHPDGAGQAAPGTGWMAPCRLDLTADAVTLTEQLVNIESVSLNEQAIADAVEAALRGARPPHGQPARQHRRRAHRPRPRRAGGDRRPPRHGARSTTTCPAAPRRTALLHGLGTCDMKGGDAVILRAGRRPCPSPTATSRTSSTRPRRSRRELNGLNLLSAERPRADGRPTSRS